MQELSWAQRLIWNKSPYNISLEFEKVGQWQMQFCGLNINSEMHYKLENLYLLLLKPLTQLKCKDKEKENTYTFNTPPVFKIIQSRLVHPKFRLIEIANNPPQLAANKPTHFELYTHKSSEIENKNLVSL